MSSQSLNPHLPLRPSGAWRGFISSVQCAWIIMRKSSTNIARFSFPEAIRSYLGVRYVGIHHLSWAQCPSSREWEHNYNILYIKVRPIIYAAASHIYVLAQYSSLISLDRALSSDPKPAHPSFKVRFENRGIALVKGLRRIVVDPFTEAWSHSLVDASKKWKSVERHWLTRSNAGTLYW